jgi:hypothetical protein
LGEHCKEVFEIPFFPDPAIGRGPDTKLLSVVGIGQNLPSPGISVEKRQKLIRGPKWNQIPKFLGNRKDLEGSSFPGHGVVTMQIPVPDSRQMEMMVVQGRIRQSQGRKSGRQIGLPDPLGQPEPFSFRTQSLFQVRAHQFDLTLLILRPQPTENRLIEAPSQNLDLSPFHHLAEKIKKGRLMVFDPFKERAGIMKGSMKIFIFVEKLESRPIASVKRLPEYMVEIPCGLVIMQDEDHGRNGLVRQNR